MVELRRRIKHIRMALPAAGKSEIAVRIPIVLNRPPKSALAVHRYIDVSADRKA
jgi:hypothetical protein